MDKSLYSLMLMDSVVREIDRIALQKNTNRSNLVNQILAEYVSLVTPEQKIDTAQRGRGYALAFDIGTTTVAGFAATLEGLAESTAKTTLVGDGTHKPVTIPEIGSKKAGFYKVEATTAK